MTPWHANPTNDGRKGEPGCASGTDLQEGENTGTGVHRRGVGICRAEEGDCYMRLRGHRDHHRRNQHTIGRSTSRTGWELRTEEAKDMIEKRGI